MIGAWQMGHVRAVPPIAVETQQIIWMWSENHNMWAHVEFLLRLGGHRQLL
jgi:hypothetical protein